MAAATDLIESAFSVQSEEDGPLCILCSGELVSWLSVPGDWRRPAFSVSYDLGWCPRCAVGRLRQKLSRDEIAAAYRVPYITHNAGPEEEDGPAPSIWQRLRGRLAGWRTGAPDIEASWVREEFGNQSLDVCEIGCGNGRILQAFQSAGHRVIGIEPDAEARQVARARGLEIFAGHAEAPPPELGSSRFDIIVMHHVLEHTESPLKALAVAGELLRPNGTLVLETPNNEAIGLKWAGCAWPWLDLPRHLHFFTASSLRDVCERSGLAVSGVEFRGYARQFQDDWVRSERQIAEFVGARNADVPRRAGSDAARWLLLALTLFARPRSRFDSVRILARQRG